jgi:hypothetical protein
VAISLGGVLIGALAAFGGSILTYRGTEETLKHGERQERMNQERDESQEWRKLQIQACQAMSNAWLDFRWLLHESASGPKVFDDKSREQIGPLGAKCAQCVTGAILVFGVEKQDSAGAAARKVDEEVSRLKDLAVEAGTGWSAETKRKIACQIKVAEEKHERFVDKAHQEIRPPSLVETHRS